MASERVRSETTRSEVNHLVRQELLVQAYEKWYSLAAAKSQFRYDNYSALLWHRGVNSVFSRSDFDAHTSRMGLDHQGHGHLRSFQHVGNGT